MLRDDVQDFTFTIDPTVDSISVSAWLEIVRRVARNRPVRFDVLEKGKFRHAWNVALRWNAGRRRWEANVEPGFVNGLDPTVRLDVDDAPPATLARKKPATVPRAASNPGLRNRPGIPWPCRTGGRSERTRSGPSWTPSRNSSRPWASGKAARFARTPWTG